LGAEVIAEVHQGRLGVVLWPEVLHLPLKTVGNRTFRV